MIGQSTLIGRTKAWRWTGDDYPDAFIPEHWANEALLILQEQMVMGNLVNRDFDRTIASAGDTVNISMPGDFKAKRKSAADNVTIQNPTVTTFPVKLDQHLHTSFIIKDQHLSLAFTDLVRIYLRKAIISIAREIDMILLMQTYRFLENAGGHLGGMSPTNGGDYLLETRETMNLNKVPDEGRRAIITDRAESNLLRNTQFTDADRIGDSGTALRTASLGELYGFPIVRALNAPFVPAGSTVTVGAINNPSGYAEGTTTFAVSGFAAAIAPGTFITVAGDDTPLQVVSTVGGAAPTSITVRIGLKHAVVSAAVIKAYTPGAINFVGGYPIAYDKELTVSGFAAAPKIGQMVTFGTDMTNIYGIIDVNGSVGITLDRPLKVAVAHSATVNVGPAGSYNFLFHRDALTLVNRPLVLPPGVRAAVQEYGSISMRVVITYDGNKQGQLVTVDTLMGTEVLNVDLGAIMYS